MARQMMTAEEVLAAYKRGERDFASANLSGANLGRANLGRANLSGANLGRADLSGADLSGADLRSAKLRGADLRDASLGGANLGRGDLFDANLRGADLGSANLSGANLSGVNLSDADLGRADLGGADLSGANLGRADLGDANLGGADLDGANLSGANLRGANLRGANLHGVDLSSANLGRADLDRANLSGAKLSETHLVDLQVDALCSVSDLLRRGPSSIDWRTVARSYRHPRLKQFMIDCGVPPVFAEFMIDCAKAEGEMNIRAMLQSTFISYGGPDELFARKLHEALRAAGVVTFFFPESATLGERISDEVFRRIQEHDRVLLVCSRASLVRVGVVNEIQETLDREAKVGGATLLLPIMLDDYVLNGWKPARADLAERLARRVIGDFRGAAIDDATFQAQLTRVVDALKVKRVPSSLPPVGTGTGGGAPP